MTVIRNHRNVQASFSISIKKRLFLFFLALVTIGFLTNISLLLKFVFQNDAPQHEQQEQHKQGPPPLVEVVHNHNENGVSPIVIGHAVSLIKCGKVAQTTGFLDAAAVLRHSIHLQSIHNNGDSKYSYQMHAIVHVDCQEHSKMLEQLGYKTLIVESPISPDEIKGEWYRNHVEAENCCGSKEFIKLYAYNLTQHPIVVHWDMDVAVLQSMDDLYDAMLFSYNTKRGQEARRRLELQHSQELPNQIDAYFTRDITSSQPWESVQGVQGGFLVLRPNPQYLQEYLTFIRKGNYIRGRGQGSGWDGLGYGGFQGAMAFQGVVAYFYDVLHPNTAVELHACRWNQVVADVLWRGPAHYDEYHLYCRQHSSTGNKTDCEDCRVTPIEKTRTAHYTACKKPWECTIPHPRKPRDQRQVYRLSHLTNITTCKLLFAKWFEFRQDLEQKLKSVSSGKYQPSMHDGGFERNAFLGYCQSSGRYIPMTPPPENYNMNAMYGM